MLPINILKALRTDSSNKDLHKLHNYNTRHKSKLYLPLANNKLYQTSFLTQALKAYDKLPKEISLCNNIKNFVLKCKAKLLCRVWRCVTYVNRCHDMWKHTALDLWKRHVETTRPQTKRLNVETIIFITNHPWSHLILHIHLPYVITIKYIL